jgi:hypothetical protein
MDNEVPNTKLSVISAHKALQRCHPPKASTVCGYPNKVQSAVRPCQVEASAVLLPMCDGLCLICCRTPLDLSHKTSVQPAHKAVQSCQSAKSSTVFGHPSFSKSDLYYVLAKSKHCLPQVLYFSRCALDFASLATESFMDLYHKTALQRAHKAAQTYQPTKSSIVCGYPSFSKSDL